MTTSQLLKVTESGTKIVSVQFLGREHTRALLGLLLNEDWQTKVMGGTYARSLLAARREAFFGTTGEQS